MWVSREGRKADVRLLEGAVRVGPLSRGVREAGAPAGAANRGAAVGVAAGEEEWEKPRVNAKTFELYFLVR